MPESTAFRVGLSCQEGCIFLALFLHFGGAGPRKVKGLELGHLFPGLCQTPAWNLLWLFYLGQSSFYVAGALRQ